jgi:hypothetical protein
MTLVKPLSQRASLPLVLMHVALITFVVVNMVVGLPN